MNALDAAGFDAKGMMGSLDAQGIGMGTAMEGLANAGIGRYGSYYWWS